PALHEPLAGVLGRRALDPEAGASADAVIDVPALADLLHPQERQQLAVEGDGFLEVAGGDEGVGDAVDFHEAGPCGVSAEGTAAGAGEVKRSPFPLIPAKAGMSGLRRDAAPLTPPAAGEATPAANRPRPCRRGTAPRRRG